MRSRVSFFALLFALGLFATPHLVHAGGVPFFGPIIPQTVNQDTCPASWGMLITVINNIIKFMITIVIVFVAPLMIAWSGFLMVIYQDSESGLGKAKKILTNTVVGILIALAGWMIVDAIMAVLYDPKAVGATWSSLITSGGISTCLDQAGSLHGAGLKQVAGVPSVVAVANPTPAGAGAGSSGMNVAAAVAWLTTNVTTTTDAGICLTDIQKAFSAGGLSLKCPGTNTTAGWAGSCNGPLQTLGFTALGTNDTNPQAGDVAVIQHVNGKNAIGHIVMFTGSSWISDFIQSSSESPPGNPYPANEFGGVQYWRP
jgi:hypothetical protein